METSNLSVDTYTITSFVSLISLQFNILVRDEDGHDRALLFDFGTAKTNSLLLRPDVHQGGGTVIWMAPTPIALEQSNWYARDVWAFGQLCRWVCAVCATFMFKT
jgi:hypothetical protein